MDETKQDIGEYPNGEDAASNAVAPEGVEGSNPLLSAEPTTGIQEFVKHRDFHSATDAVKGRGGKRPDRGARIKEEVMAGPKMYRLNLYRPNGTLRSEISKAVFNALAGKWGDVIRCIPSSRWVTMDDLVQLVWEFEKKSYLKAFSRTRKQVENAVSELVEAGAILTK